MLMKHDDAPADSFASIVDVPISGRKDRIDLVLTLIHVAFIIILPSPLIVLRTATCLCT
jgi:hypothetical protein